MFKTVAISLKNNSERRDFIKNQIKIFDHFEIFDACNGNDILITNEIYGVVKLEYQGKKRNYNPRIRLNHQIMKKGELGCAWSHLSVYEKLIKDTDFDAYLILEDDAELVLSLEELKTFLNNLPDFSSFDVCHIFESLWYPFNRINEVNSHFSNIEKRFFSHAGAYFITKNGAQKLLNSCYLYFGLPADDLLSNTFLFSDDFKVIVSNKLLFKSKGFNSSIDLINNGFLKNIISMKEFGTWARLGNQMFQYAFLKVLSIKYDFLIQLPRLQSPFGFTQAQLFSAFDLEIENLDSSINFEHYINETSHLYKDNYTNIHSDNNVLVKGYFQSEKYFKEYEDIIRKCFQFKEEYLSKAKIFLSNFKTKKVAVHLRLTDFLSSDSPNVPINRNYIEESIKYISNKIKDYQIFVFSDDKNMSKEILSGMENLIYVESFSDIEELCIMSLCDHFIISPSTFSWWGAWLSQNDDKIVITPKKWFSDKISYGKPLSEQSEDIIPSEWIRL